MVAICNGTEMFCPEAREEATVWQSLVQKSNETVWHGQARYV